MIESMAGAAVITATNPFNRVLSGTGEAGKPLKGNIHHSVSQWCYGDIPLPQFATSCKEMGLESIELLGENDWPVVQKAGLKCAVGYATDFGIQKGFNRLYNHEKLISDFTTIDWDAAYLIETTTDPSP